MKLLLVFLVVFVLSIWFVSAADSWGEFVDDVSPGGDGVLVDSGGAGASDEGGVNSNPNLDMGAGETSLDYWRSTQYTQEFYIALGVGVGVVLLLLLLLFLFLRKPRNRWKKK